MSASIGFRYHIRVLKTLLSRPPRDDAGFWTAISFVTLVTGCLWYWSGELGAAEWMPASRRAVFENGEVWRLLTTLFAHADFGHLLANSFMYIILGYLLCGYFGPVVYPLFAWGLAIPMTALTLLTYPPGTQLIGASGLVHLMGGLWLSLYFFLSRNLRLTQRILRAVGVMLAIFFPSSFEEKVSYRAHFIGLAVGLIAGGLWFHWRRRELQSFDEVDIEYEPDPALLERAETASRLGQVDPSQSWEGFEDWEDVSEVDGTALVDDATDDDEWDGDDDDKEDPPGAKKPRRLGPNRGNA